MASPCQFPRCVSARQVLRLSPRSDFAARRYSRTDLDNAHPPDYGNPARTPCGTPTKFRKLSIPSVDSAQHSPSLHQPTSFELQANFSLNKIHSFRPRLLIPASPRSAYSRRASVGCARESYRGSAFQRSNDSSESCCFEERSLDDDTPPLLRQQSEWSRRRMDLYDEENTSPYLSVHLPESKVCNALVHSPCRQLGFSRQRRRLYSTRHSCTITESCSAVRLAGSQLLAGRGGEDEWLEGGRSGTEETPPGEEQSRKRSVSENNPRPAYLPEARDTLPSLSVTSDLEPPPTAQSVSSDVFLATPLSVSSSKSAFGKMSLRRRSSRTPLTSKIGSGGFGSVYCGFYDGAKCAIKQLKGPRARNISFCSELNAFKLSHPNIIKILTFTVHDQFAQLVYEYVGSRNLQQTIDHQVGSFPVRFIRRYAVEINSGLNFCHENGICHLDVKPANVLLTDFGGTCKLSDFGCSMRLPFGKRSVTLSTDHKTDGTLIYRAPELLRFPAVASPFADIYSFGILLWQLITRRQPYSDLDGHAVVYCVVARGLRPEWLAEDWEAWLENGGQSEPCHANCGGNLDKVTFKIGSSTEDLNSDDDNAYLFSDNNVRKRSVQFATEDSRDSLPELQIPTIHEGVVCSNLATDPQVAEEVCVEIVGPNLAPPLLIGRCPVARQHSVAIADLDDNSLTPKYHDTVKRCQSVLLGKKMRNVRGELENSCSNMSRLIPEIVTSDFDTTNKVLCDSDIDSNGFGIQLCDWQSLVESCWATDINVRPTAAKIVSIVS